MPLVAGCGIGHNIIVLEQKPQTHMILCNLLFVSLSLT